MSDIQADKDSWQEAAAGPAANLPPWIAALGRVLDDRRRAWSNFGFAFVLAIAVRLVQTVNNDIAWYIHSAGALLDGGTLYRDIFFEVNPPLMLYLTVPPVYLARLLDVFPVIPYVLYVFLLIGLSLALFGQVLRHLPGLSPAARRGLVLTAFLVLAIVPAGDFGQREHMLLIFALPYVALIALRAAGGSCGLSLAIPVGALAVFGLAIKPHFLLLPALLELYLLLHTRSLARGFRGETISLAAAGLGYGAAVYLFTPAYLDTIVPYALEVYNNAYRNTLAFVLARQETLLVPGAAVLYLAVRRRLERRALIDVFLLAAVTLFAIYLVQMKGWNYHLYPTTAWLVMTFGAVLTGNRTSVPAAQDEARTRRVLPLAALAIVTALTVKPLFNPGNSYRLMDLLEPTVKQHAQGQAIYFFSSNTWTAFPLVLYAEVAWPSRFPALWLLPGVQQQRRNPEGGDRPILDEIERFTTEAVIADLTRVPPALVMVDARPEKSWYEGVEFDFIEHFSADPRFREIWSRYEKIEDIQGFEVYRRCSNPC